MEAAPRSWQFSLSNWPVTRKVGIVLVLPVLLAATFAVLRINSELQTISKLSAASDQMSIIRSTAAFVASTNDLAVTAIAGDNQDVDPALDAAATKFDQAAAAYDTAIKESNADPAIAKELTTAIAEAKSMRNSLRSSSPQTIGDQADAVHTRVQNSLINTITVGDLRVQQSFLQFGAALTSSRLLTQERVMLAVPGAASNPALRTKLLTALGAEITMIEVYRGMAPESAQNADLLKDNAGARVGILMQNVPDPGSLPAMQDSLRTSADAYQNEITAVANAMDSKLSRLITEARNNVLRDTSVVIGMLLAGLALALVVARSLVVPVRRLRRDALQVAHIDLPQELEVVRAGGATPEISPVDVHTTEEIGQLARAVDDIHSQALHLAAEQARLRLQIGNMFETLSRRSQSLVEQQLGLIEELERDEDDSERLQSLFRLDHLATRMRRNGDNLLVLAGTALRRGHLAPVPLSDMLWSSVSQVEDYQRVEIGTVPDGIVAGEPAVDIEHLLAELIDNALRYSPPTTPVAVSVARAVDGGYLIEITDRGLGMNAEDLQGINDRLASGGEVNVETARRMGLFVVGRLAKRHNITVSLRRTSAMVQQPGITASVHLPGSLVSPAPERTGDPTGQYAVPSALPVPPAALASGPIALPTGPNPLPTGPNPLATGPHSLTNTGPNSLATGPVGLPSGPSTGPQPITPPRLMPVPNPPEPAPSTTTGRFATTSSGLPQRKPGLDTGEQPAVPAFRGEQPHRDRFSDGFTDAFSEPDEARAYGVTALRPQSEPPQPEPETPEPAPAQMDFWGEAGAQQTSEPVAPITGGNNYAYGFSAEAESAGTSFGNGYSAFGTGEHPVARPSEDGYVVAGAPNGNTGYGATDIRGNEATDIRGNDAAPAAPRPVAPQAGPRPAGDAPAPIFQRMVSEWLVEPAATEADSAAWSLSSDPGWAAAEEAANPNTSSRTQGGLPIRRPGAQLVPGAVAQEDDGEGRNPEEIRNSLSRHLSGVRSGRADSQYNDGGHA
ncbi:HAMP domain-containing protein [Nocardia sp. ET3-3]|uniref:histidine kinase n=1 Tax=Nocardia terrae TaxID=2675851 RepID=A0A7K1V8S6_9NOCA|nr:ATP-binding protein [Nocardia terrae]MVU82947.1 HAMP domain-containing protein [Nocardia terrae]